MPQYRFCSKCGASLVDGEERCRLCRTAVDDMPVVTASTTGGTSPAATPDGTPFVSMWLSPRATIRGILDTDPRYMVLPLAAAGGVFEALSRAAGRNAGDVLSLPVLLGIALVFGPLGGMAGLYIAGALLHFTGRWLGGTATRQEVRASIAWGTVPALWGGLLWIPLLGLGGGAIFTSDLENSGLSAAVLLLSGGMLIVQGIAAIWSIFTGLHSLGEAQGFSAWRALGSSALAFLVILVPIVTIGLGLAFLATTVMRV
jgi:hypothetical protein